MAKGGGVWVAIGAKGMMVNYTITKRYDSKYFVVTKEALIYLRTDGEQIVESKGAIFVSGI